MLFPFYKKELLTAHIKITLKWQGNFNTEKSFRSFVLAYGNERKNIDESRRTVLPLWC